MLLVAAYASGAAAFAVSSNRHTWARLAACSTIWGICNNSSDANLTMALGSASHDDLMMTPLPTNSAESL